MYLDTVTVAVLFMNPTFVTTPVRAMGGIVSLEERYSVWLCYIYICLYYTKAGSMRITNEDRIVHKRNLYDQAATSSDWVCSLLVLLGAYLEFFRRVAPYLLAYKTCIIASRA